MKIPVIAIMMLLSRYNHSLHTRLSSLHIYKQLSYHLHTYNPIKCQDLIIPQDLSSDARKIAYVGDWKYWYRLHGMQTSTEDVLLAYLSLYSHDSLDTWRNDSILHNNDRKAKKIEKYLDLGTGIGSTLLLVSYTSYKLAYNTICHGIEAQSQSYMLLNQTLHDNNLNKKIQLFHHDLRDLSTIINPKEHQYDVITANPPYIPLNNGTKPKDNQLKEAKFEFRGGIEEYCEIASKYLHPHGKFLVSCWSRDKTRVQNAGIRCNLTLFKTYNFKTSLFGNSHLAVVEFRSNHCMKTLDMKKEYDYDITRQDNGKLSELYKFIRCKLEMHPKPLSQKKKLE